MKIVSGTHTQANHIKNFKNENNTWFTRWVTQEAMQSTDIKTKTKVIVLALQELINKNKVAALKSYKGKVDLDMDIDSLRKRNTQDRLF